MKRLVRATIGLLPILSGCGGTVIESSPARMAETEQRDKAPMGYYLPRAEIPITVTFVETKRALMVTYDQIPKMVADTKFGPLYLYYKHAGLSSEKVSLSVGQDGLLKKVSSTSVGQTAEAIKGLNDIITQVSNLRAASANIETLATAPKCEGVSARITVDINPLQKIAKVQPLTQVEGCRFTASQKITPVDARPGSPENALLATAVPLGSSAELKDQCAGKVCFRTQRAYRVQTTISFSGSDIHDSLTVGDFVVMAPDPSLIGFIQFDRGVFASKTMTAEFTDGILTSFSADNASEIVGFLAVPAAALTTATLITKLN
ncbi:hypothetical protein [Rhizobium leguminosarum]|uniref:hypothetical protein n=1 Tax=Rhizobium leguminosarum TaxID=384 RepID=UPI001441997A|nr:hypothetical protein [Rhizobium leguminosarum]NKJ77821.1 hypothetical protein [Rhizobium leguminosarum bv. viciae]